MDHFQRWGGVAALIEAATYIVGFGLLFTALAPLAGSLTPDEHVAFLADNQALMYLWNLIIYIVNGIFLVVLVLALYRRLQRGSPALAQTATAFGLIWAGLVIASGMVANIGANTVVGLHATQPNQAVPVWSAISAVQEGLGGGNEIVGGMWVGLLSWAALRTGGLPRLLNYLGLVIGAAGLLTIVPALGEPGGAVFGLGFILWFIGAGVAMLRGSPDAAVQGAFSPGR